MPVCACSRGRGTAKASTASCTDAGRKKALKIQHPERRHVAKHAPQRHGTVHFGSSSGLPDLLRQRRLRAAGHGGRPSACAKCATALTAPIISTRKLMTRRIPISPSMPSKCIVCSRCVRACDEVQGTFALTIEGRGFDSKVSRPVSAKNSSTSECVSCGACVQACPTATLMEKERHRTRHAGAQSSETTCAYCGVGCSFKRGH